MQINGLKQLGSPPLFDPQRGQTVLEPPGAGVGNWAGAPSVLWDEQTRKFLMYYRLRRPRNPDDPNERGYECRIAVSEDGLNFETIWSATKHQFDAQSVERAALVKYEDGYRLYLALETRDTHRWEIWLLDADDPTHFDPGAARPFLQPFDDRVAHVKDPVVLRVGGLWHFYVNFHPARWQSSSSALVVSEDGIRPYWLGDVLSGTQGWDATISRITTILHDPPLFWAFYDGGETMRESCEERTGLAFSFDLRTFQRLSLNGPALVSPHGTHSLRYCEAVPVDDRWLVYYEYTRPDGSHELRVSEVRRSPGS